MSEKKDSFVFYRSFYESINVLNDDDRLRIYDAICDLALNDNDAEFNGILLGLFTLIKPQIQANTKKWKDGKKGGRPKGKTTGYEGEKTTGYKKKKTTGYKLKKPNVNVNVNENVNDKEKIYKKENLNSFDEWYDKYPKKVGRGAAEKSFKNTIKTITLEELLCGLDKYLCWLKQNPKKKEFIPNPSTWLNQKRWLDQYETFEEDIPL